MKYVWDKRKCRGNIALHGIAFEDAIRIFEGPTLERVDDRFDYGETRIYAIGVVNGLEITLIYAEVSIGFTLIEEVDAALPMASFRRLDLPYEAAFLAGKAFSRYRKQGGTRTATLPDFFIGAHAAISGLQLLTRDDRRYRTYFPTITILSP